MPKRKRREQQHLRQESARRKTYTMGGSSPKELYKPGFPMNLLGNLKLFSIVGVVIAGIMVVTMVLIQSNGGGGGSGSTPTATPTASTTGTPSSATPTPNPRVFSKPEQVIDASKFDYSAIVKTSMGTFTLSLDASIAPNTVNNFAFLSEKGFYNGLTFHRVIPNFIIQGGDPNGNGTGGPGYTVKDEPNKLKNLAGTIAMAKTPGASSFGSQFFINVRDNPSLDFDNTSGDKFYPFGKVTNGMSVVDAISKVPTDASNKPLKPVTIESVVIEQTPKAGGPATAATIPPSASATATGTPTASATPPTATPTP